MDDAGTEHERGWLRIEDGLSRESAPATAPEDARGPRRRGRHAGARQHAPPPLPDAHARAGAAGRPVHVAEDAVPDLGAASTTRWSTPPPGPGSPSSRSRAARRSSTTTTSSRAASRASSRPSCARRSELGVRIVASRGSMDLGESDGGPAARLARRGHRRRSSPTPSGSPRSPTATSSQIAVAPCSPFSVTTRLMEESAALARRLGLQLHTHLAETVEEDAYCRELFGCTPVEYLERVGWIADDVWCAHCVHLSDGDVRDVRRARRRRRALPDVEPAARRGRRAGARPARRGRARRARRRRHAPRTSAATCSSR